LCVIVLQRLLNFVGNDVEQAVNRYYEHGIPSVVQKSSTSVAPVQPLHSPNTLNQRRANLIRNPRTMAWLIGRRIAFGYTLNSGIALRLHALHFKFEGQLLEKSKKQFFSSKLKQKQKFSAANLLFECRTASKVRSLLSFNDSSNRAQLCPEESPICYVVS
jgi:hypothetical protein